MSKRLGKLLTRDSNVSSILTRETVTQIVFYLVKDYGKIQVLTSKDSSPAVETVKPSVEEV